MNLRQLESKYPCVCEHLEYRHGYCSGQYVCWECLEIIAERLQMTSIYPGHRFMPDNLLYLEGLNK